MTEPDKPTFLNFRATFEMPFYQRIIWRIFGKKHTDYSNEYGMLVTAYEFRNVTLVWSLQND